MRSQNYFFIAVLILIAPRSAGADQKQKVDIEQATVFLSGAEVLSSAKINLPKGESEVVFTNVAYDVKPQSISVGAGNGVVVESTIFMAGTDPDEANSQIVKDYQDSVQLLVEVKCPLDNRLSVLTAQIDLIQNNNSSKDGRLSVTELDKMLNLVNERLEKLLDEKLSLEKSIAKIDQQMTQLNRQIAEEQGRRIPGGQLKVKFYSPAAINTEARFAYVVQNAGWVPMYDLRVDKLNAPVKLYYKANVHQNCGVKWDNIKLVLSTGNPHETAQAPTLEPMYLAFEYSHKALAEVAITAYKNPLIEPGRPSGNLSSEDIKGSGFGGRGNASRFLVDDVAVNGVSDYVQVDNSGVNTSFDIDLPYTLASDGQQHMVAIRNYELPAVYRYYAVPKKDPDVFLQAQVTKWEDLDLLPATTNIYYEGTFVGQGITDVRNVKDTMNFSLGRDKKIIVKREGDRRRHIAKTIGTSIKEGLAYDISVRNARKEPITLTLLDQVPMSSDKDISVEDMEYQGGTLEEDNGEVKWVMDVKPNETRQVKLAYTIKHPRGKPVVMR
jgi:uncharacterized protein (TIGR02231 family)